MRVGLPVYVPIPFSVYIAYLPVWQVKTYGMCNISIYVGFIVSINDFFTYSFNLLRALRISRSIYLILNIIGILH